MPYVKPSLRLIHEHKTKTCFIYRDPRDQIVSEAYFLRKHQWFFRRLQQVAKLDTETGIPSHNIILTLLMPTWNKLKTNYVMHGSMHLTELFEWKKHPSVYAVKYENLVGPKGGAHFQTQIQEILNIAKHIGHPVTVQRAHEIAEELFGGTFTFRKGTIGQWKEEFTKEHKQLFKEHAGQLLIELGYEQDMNW